MAADLPPLHADQARTAIYREYRGGDRPARIPRCWHPSTRNHPFGAPQRVRCTVEWDNLIEFDDGGPEGLNAVLTVPLPIVAVRRPDGRIEVVEPWG